MNKEKNVSATACEALACKFGIRKEDSTAMASAAQSPRISTCLHKGTSQFWAMPYDPEQPRLAPGNHLFADACSNGIVGAELSLTTELVEPFGSTTKTFTRCWINAELNGLNITGWEFTECAFDGSVLKDVKFGDCKFTRCHFNNCTFINCAFTEKNIFVENSASAELWHLQETMIDPTSFLGSLTTNLKHLPKDKDPKIQQHRHIRTKMNIAMLIYNSNRNESNLDYYFAAYKELVLSVLSWNIEKHRYTKAADSVLKPRGKVAFFFVTLLTRIEMILVSASGWLTQWGRSLSRSMLFFATVVLFFTFVYFANGWVYKSPTSGFFASFYASLIKAVNITVVAGYTAHYSEKSSPSQQTMECLNLLLGVLWYSLVIPVLTRKTIR